MSTTLDTKMMTILPINFGISLNILAIGLNHHDNIDGYKNLPETYYTVLVGNLLVYNL